MNDKVIELTTQQLEDYIKCPNLFYIRHVNGILSKTHVTIRSIAEKYKDRMLYSLMDGKIPDIDKVLLDFDKECIENKYPATHRDVQKASNQLVILFNWLIANRVQIADIGTPFQLTFPEVNVILKGTFGAIRHNSKKLELLGIDFSAKDPDQDLVDMSIRYTVQAYAVHKLIKNYELSCIHVIGVRFNRVQELQSYRSEIDYTRVEKTVQNVARAIRNSIFYPRESYECTYCPVKAYCSGILDYVTIGETKNAD